MRAGEIAELLEGVDSLLFPREFKRPSRSREWRKKVDRSTEAWVHINVGLDIVDPSIGVTYLDLADVLPKDAGSVNSTMRMLGPLFKPAHTYSLGAGPKAVLTDLHDAGLPELSVLLDRHTVAKML